MVHKVKNSLKMCLFSAANLTLEAGSVTAVLRGIIASPTASLVTVIKTASRLMCVTRTQESVSARWVFFKKKTLHAPLMFISLPVLILSTEKRRWCQVWCLPGRILLFWPLQPSGLHQLLLLRSHWPLSELQQTQRKGVCCSCPCMPVEASAFCVWRQPSFD